MIKKYTNINITKKLSLNNNIIINISFKKNFSLKKPIINENNTFLHDHYRHDGFNQIKTSKYFQKEIVTRENQTYKNWKKSLNQYFNEWEKTVNLYSLKDKKDFGEIIGEYEYFEETTPEGYDILYRKNKQNKKQVVLDIKQIPFLIDINKTVLKGMRLCPLLNRVSFIVDLENNEKYFGGIYDIEKKSFYKCKFENVNCIEFTKFENYFVILQNDMKNRPCLLKGVYLSENKEIENQEIILFEEINDNIFLETSPSKDNKFLIINSMTKNDTSIYTLNLSELETKPKQILERSKGLKYFTDHANVNSFLINVRENFLFYQI